GFGFTDLVIFGIVLNVVAGVSTILAGRLDDHFGPKPVILFTIAGLVVCCLTVFFGAALGSGLFWAAGIVLAAFVGPAQAASRSFLARVTPAGQEGEIFGLYATTGRAAGWMASLLWSVFIVLAANQTLYGILGIALVLAVGFVLLCFVKAPARVAAESPPPAPRATRATRHPPPPGFAIRPAGFPIRPRPECRKCRRSRRAAGVGC